MTEKNKYKLDSTSALKNLICLLAYHQDKISLDFTSSLGFGKVVFQDVTLAVMYNKNTDTEMSECFWNNAPGSDIIVRVNSSLLGYDFDDENVLFGLSNEKSPGEQIKEITQKVLSAWNELTDKCEDILDDSDHFENPFNLEIVNGNINLAKVRIGHHWNENESQSGLETVRLINDDDEIFIEPGLNKIIYNLHKIFKV